MARTVALVVVLLVVGLGLWEVVRPVLALVSQGAPARADELVVAIVAAVALAITAWLAAGVVVVALASVPGRLGRAAAGVADVLTPWALRRVVGVALGVTVAAGVTPGASLAAPGPPSMVVVLDQPDPGFAPLPDPGWGVDAGSGIDAGSGVGGPGVGGGPDDGIPAASAPDPGWVPAPPVVRPQPDLRVLAPSRPGKAADDVVEVVVRRGDTLWSIAARHLGPRPSEAEVARAWPAWYAANRAVVGDDPDRLRPGQVLRAPEGVVS